MFVQHEGDQQQLMKVREVAGLEGPPTRTERVKFIRRVVGEPDSVAERMILVLKAHQELDFQCHSQAEAAGLEVNLTAADIAYPLITQRVTDAFQQQLIHVHNGCTSDDPEHLPYVKVGTVNYHLTGHHLEHYQSLRSTSKVEAVHSVLDRTSTPTVAEVQRFLMHVWGGGFWGTIDVACVLLARRFLLTVCHQRYV